MNVIPALSEIVDATKLENGQDSVFCVGVCSTWVHRQCVGLSSQAFKLLGESTRPYSCPNCELDSQKCEIMNLKNEIALLKSVLNYSSTKNCLSTSFNNSRGPLCCCSTILYR